MAELRPNRIKHKLQDGGIVTCIQGYMTADLAEVFASLGFDGIWIEAEHGPVDFDDMPDFTRACDVWGVTSLVRVNSNTHGLIYRTLDQGAQGVAIPHVNTAAEARAVVDAVKFHPLGTRGSFTSRQGLGVPDYFARANDETMTLVLIEDIVAVDNLSEILEVDDIDVFFVAPGDLAQSMGFPGRRDLPQVQAAIDRAIGQIVDSGRVAGTLVSDSTVEAYMAKGVRFVSTNWNQWVAAAVGSFMGKVAGAAK